MKEKINGWEFLTDLATERGRIPYEGAGIEHEREDTPFYSVERIRITSTKGERAIERPMGRYHTVSCRPFHTLRPEETEAATTAIATELARLCAPYLDKEGRVLIVGLGNKDALPDSIGVLACSDMRPTAIIKKQSTPLFRRLGCRETYVLCPDVEGKTGIPTDALVRTVAKEMDTALIIAVDALCTRSYERLASTVQLSDTGIFPGSGLGKRHERIAKETVGVPVVAIGIPTVQSAYAFLLEQGERHGTSDVSSIPKHDAYLCKTTLKEDVEIGARMLTDAIERVMGIHRK